MKPRCSNRRDHALTLLEVVTIVGVLFLLFVFFAQYQYANTSLPKARRISCINNLKQIGLASSVWADDHNNRFPMEVSATNGGIKELLSGGFPSSQLALKNFLILSNQLTIPSILYCPSDEQATRAIEFNSNFNNTNLSYFASPDADKLLPQTILSGDDNLSRNDVSVNPGLLNLPTNTPIAWTAERHRKAGNIGLADGSAQQLTSYGLQMALQQTGLATNHFVIP